MNLCYLYYLFVVHAKKNPKCIVQLDNVRGVYFVPKLYNCPKVQQICGENFYNCPPICMLLTME